MPGQPPAHNPGRTVERALAPDLARGFMLLFIAVANTVWYLWAVPTAGMGTAHPEAEGILDRVTQFAIVAGVDMRSYPMFAFLFGYGMVQLTTRLEAGGAGPREADAMLRRRNLWLLVFGFFHALLLFVGDILGAYGLAGLVLGWLFLRRRISTLKVWVAILLGVMALLAGSSLMALLFAPADQLAAQNGQAVVTMDVMMGSFAEGSALAAAGERALVWPLSALGQGLLGLAVPTAIVLGFLTARSRVLEEPGQHLPLLRWTALLGISAGWLGGLPLALAQTGLWDLNPAQAQLLTMPHMVTGLLCGLGYIALIALIAHRIRERGRTHGVVLTAVTATGKRSLTSYLAQSVLCAPLLAAWGLGLGAHLTSWSMALFGIGVWLVTVAAAYAMERAGRRGPAETLLRRLAYRSSGKRAAADPPGEEPQGADQERTTP